MIIQFIKWWWNRRNTGEKIVLSVLSWFIICLINVFVFGWPAFFIFYGGIAVVALCALLWVLILGIMSQWHKFREERDREAQLIIERLGG